MLWHLKQPGGDEAPCAFEHHYRQDFWAYLKSKPESEEVFSKAMENGDLGKLRYCSALMGRHHMYF